MPRPQLPVRARAAVAAALAAAVCLGGGALWLRHVIHANSVAGSVATARSQARAIASTYDTPAARSSADGGALAGGPEAYDRWYEFPYYGMPISFVVADDHGRVLLAQHQLATYLREGGLTLPAVAPELDQDLCGQVEVHLRPARSGARGPLDNRDVILVTCNVSPSGGTVYLLVPPLDAQAAVAPVDRWLRIGLPAAVLFVAAVAWWAAGRALRPVERMRAELARITAADLSSRVPELRTGDEIARLAGTMNDTLGRLADAAERQRRFVADAAHELRSPIAGLRTAAEVAATHGGPVDPELLRTGTERLQRLTDDLLLLARLERTAPARGEPVDIAALVEELAGERRYRVPPDERFVVVAGAPAAVPGREEELGRMLGNLLDNAARYARDRIEVTVTQPGPGRVRVEVHDDGPGIPPADRERVFERFARVDEARDRRHGGAGLGLAIARDIAERHGGRLYAADASSGARLVVELPAAVSG
ncbi:cell wall metabolism sensor histidine kinase WalK [Actinoplanes sp. N902-109]|uniref:sensor histidine kinase n=1 Tax=Actinoplanes sp. (strain N902-109) TaxID=649831 RepID=UPI00032965F3|nr:HAMP domain-containing sensor histidine kinase [Actinoplanes sp. N902-109]AGL17420.1 histidine kinase [Actinoplanes sp. N902-109]